MGSRLKNPPLPIWVTCVNDKWGVLFSNNMELMKLQTFENRQGSLVKKNKRELKWFCRHTMYYYSCKDDPKYLKKETIIVICAKEFDTFANSTFEGENFHDNLKKAIQTK